MLRILYGFLLSLAIPFVLLRFYWRSCRLPAYRRHLRERLGFSIHSTGSIVIHAVSLGESIAATPMIAELIRRFPQHDIIVTNTTPTGRAHILRHFGDAVKQCYVPLDVPFAVKRFLKRTNVKVMIIMETELWPTLLHQLRQRAIPSLLVNARLSARSQRGYARFPRQTRQMLQTFQVICAQSDIDAARFTELGASNVRSSGNLKFDLDIAADLEQRAMTWRQSCAARPIWVAASTHPSEEASCLQAHQAILREHKQALLILVPRHPERFDEVADLCQQQGFTTQRRSVDNYPHASTQVFVADTLGEMMLWYASCDMAFVAGSLAPIGGHNLIEPAALRKPVITGPHLGNCEAIRDYLQAADGMRIIQSAESLAKQCNTWWQHPEQAAAVAENAYSAVSQHRGACLRICQQVEHIYQEAL